MQLPTTLQNSQPFEHSNECRVHAADKSFMPEWTHDPQDSTLWTRECGCHKDYYRMPYQENRPPQPDASRHRHAQENCGIADFIYESDGRSGVWRSECKGCGTVQRYYPAGERPAGFFPDPIPFDEDQLNSSITRPDPREVEKRRILDALGIEETDLAALVAARGGKK